MMLVQPTWLPFLVVFLYVIGFLNAPYGKATTKALAQRRFELPVGHGTVPVVQRLLDELLTWNRPFANKLISFFGFHMLVDSTFHSSAKTCTGCSENMASRCQLMRAPIVAAIDRFLVRVALRVYVAPLCWRAGGVAALCFAVGFCDG